MIILETIIYIKKCYGKNTLSITGALSHIGSFLIKNLYNYFSNAEYILIDNFKTQRYVSLFNLPKSMRYNFFEKDVRCRSIKNLFSESDIIIHLAAITDATSSFKNSKEVEENNLLLLKI